MEARRRMELRTCRLARRTIAGLALLAVGVLFITGCDTEGYSDDMRYPLRTDPIFLKAPDTQPYAVDPPGALNHLPERIKELGGKILDPKDLAAKKSKERGQLEKRLEEVFGTPAHPKVDGKLGDSEEDIADALKLKDDDGKDRLAAGSRLFRRHCLHCHGLTGDGHGPTAEWVNPHPRDYRKGIFKFTSSNQDAGKRKPRREDLKRTLHNGIEGTSMPSFGLLLDSELEELVGYVVHLSLRGEVESVVMQKLIEDDNLEGDSVVEETDKQLGRLANFWKQAQDPEKLITPGPYPAMSEKSVKNGYKLFLDQSQAGCVSCHKDFGRQNNYKWDSWGTIVRPIDFTSGVYRGGRRPIDFYWRIHSGINGSGMSAFFGPLNSDQIWDLVNFLQVLPYPEMRRKFGIEID
jgi:mono/diheme cytochrome c family protein